MDSEAARLDELLGAISKGADNAMAKAVSGADARLYLRSQLYLARPKSMDGAGNDLPNGQLAWLAEGEQFAGTGADDNLGFLRRLG